MPEFNVKLYNDESGMLHSEYDVYAADEKSAQNVAVQRMRGEQGYDAPQSNAAEPRFRASIREIPNGLFSGPAPEDAPVQGV